MGSIEANIARLINRYQRLTGRVLTIGTVESATAGKVGDRITNIPGSSKYYKGSVISYSNEIKSRIIGVSQETLKKKGSVSSETACEMARGGRQLLSVDICVADTGIAGPTGETPDKPIGLFHIALSAADGNELQQRKIFIGNRLHNKKAAADSVLCLIEDYLQKKINWLFKIKFQEKKVITSFIEHKGKILLLRRSQKVGSYRGKWSGVSGYLEDKPMNQAYNEIREETNLNRDKVIFINEERPITIMDESLGTKWIVYPFLFRTEIPDDISIDWESTEIKWVAPEDIDQLDTVPGLKEALYKVLKISKTSI